MLRPILMFKEDWQKNVPRDVDYSTTGRASPKHRHFDRFCASRIQRIPAAFTRSSVHLVGVVPTLRLPVLFNYNICTSLTARPNVLTSERNSRIFRKVAFYSESQSVKNTYNLPKIQLGQVFDIDFELF